MKRTPAIRLLFLCLGLGVGAFDTGVVGSYEQNERTAPHDYEDGVTKRTHSDPHAARSRSSDVDKRGQGHSHTHTNHRNGHDGDGSVSDSRNHSNKKQHNGRHKSTEKASVHKHHSPKTASNHPLSEDRSGEEIGEVTVASKTEAHPIGLISAVGERSGAGKQESAVQAISDAHPIGLINALGGKATRSSRSMELHSREMDTTTTILVSSLSGVALLALIFICCCAGKSQAQRERDSSKGLLTIFQYLSIFNVDDVDIQLSAAGGYHVGYMNGLAKGVNTKKPPVPKTEIQSDENTDSSSDNGENGSKNLSKRV